MGDNLRMSRREIWLKEWTGFIWLRIDISDGSKASHSTVCVNVMTSHVVLIRNVPGSNKTLQPTIALRVMIFLSSFHKFVE